MAPHLETGYFLEISGLTNLDGDDDRSIIDKSGEVLKGLREWAKHQQLQIEIWPRIGEVSAVIRVTCRDSIPPQRWEEIKIGVIGIVQKHTQKGGNYEWSTPTQ